MANKPEPCPVCNGEGWLMESEGEPCPACSNPEYLGGTGIAGGVLPEDDDKVQRVVFRGRR